MPSAILKCQRHVSTASAVQGESLGPRASESPAARSGRKRPPVSEVRSPTVRRRELGALLRALRNERGLTVEQVAERLLCSPSKVSRMETGHGITTSRDIRDLCVLYHVTDAAERDRMMTLAREGKRRAWWQSYDLAYANYVGLEEEAVAISAFQSSVVHGLLHTPDYARAGHEGAMPRLEPHQIDLQIEAKLTRQRILTRDDP